jgi:alpha-tubulin suppressor-like RCC1 family protein
MQNEKSKESVMIEATWTSRVGAFSRRLLAGFLGSFVLSVACHAAAPVATISPASGITNVSATLNAGVNPGGSDTVAWFEWDVTAASIFRRRTAPQTLGNSSAPVALSAQLNDLLPGVVYHGRVVASNGFGVVRSRDVFFRSMTIELIGPNPLATACASFDDPGATARALPSRLIGGAQYCLALKADGTMVGWGRNLNGVLNCPPLSNVVAISAASLHNLALLADGTVAAWGDSSYGKTAVPPSAQNIVAVAAGGDFSLALRDDGRVIAWGDNLEGQTSVPASAFSEVVAISAGAWHSLALKSDGNVIAWGAGKTVGLYHDHGQSIVPPEATNVVAVAAGAQNSMVLRSDGSVLVWGQSCCGITNVPASATNIVGIALAVNSTYCLALRPDDTVIGWGSGCCGQTATPAEATNVVAIAAGGLHTIVTRADGSLVAWGDGGFGQLPVPADITSNSLAVSTIGTIVPNAPGTYDISYSVTSADGSTATTNRLVLVTNAPPSFPLVVGGLVSNDTFRLVFTNSACGTFAVLGTTNIAAIDWPVLGPAVEVGPGQYEFTDSSAGGPQRFYRVLVLSQPAPLGSK